MLIQPNHRRKPEFNERYYICRTIENYSTNFIIIVQYNRQISHNLLSNALYSLIKEQLVCQNFSNRSKGIQQLPMAIILKYEFLSTLNSMM